MLALIPVMLLVATMCGAFYYWLRQRGLAAEEQAHPQDRRRASLLTELTGYIGALLVLAGGGVTVGQSWNTMTAWDHAGVFGGFALFFLVIGLVVFWVDEAAIQRMIGMLWLISALCAGAAAGIAAHDVLGAAGAQTALATGLSITIYSAALWLIRRRELQLVALFAGLTIAVSAGIIAIAGSSVPWLPFALGLWAFGIGWVIVGWQYPQPLWTTVPLGTLIALIGPAFAVWAHGWVFVLAIATAAVAMAVSIPVRNTLLLAAGTLALFGYIAAGIVRYFHASLGVPATLATCGVLLIVFALVMARMRHQPRGEEPTGPRMAGHWTAGSRLVAPRTSAPRTVVPPTAVPRTAVPPTAVPRTAVPRRAVPPTAARGAEHTQAEPASPRPAGRDPEPQPEREPGSGEPEFAEPQYAEPQYAEPEYARSEVAGPDPATLELPRAS